MLWVMVYWLFLDIVEAMKNFVCPISMKDMRAFLGSTGYYRKFIPNFSNYSPLLTLSNSAKASGKVHWSSEMVSPFRKLCNSLCNHCILNVPLESDSFVLHTDASCKGMGCVLNVSRNDVEVPEHT